MQELIEYIAKALVSNPDQVKVNCSESDGEEVYELHVAADDRGKVIGKKGRTVHAIRTLLSATAGDGKSISLEVVD